MTKTDSPPAGQFDLDWMAACRSNEGDEHETLEAWVCRARNCATASIDPDGSVWCDHRWLSQQDCNKTAATIDRGV